jgi:DNA replication protein DnaC
VRRIDEVLAMIDSATTLPPALFGTDGQELLSSKLRRAVLAEREFKARALVDPTLAIERAERLREAEEVAVAQRQSAHEADQHARTPSALRSMGLVDREIEALGDVRATPIVVAVREFMASPDIFFTIGGVMGGGKTIAAASALLSMKERFSAPSLGSVWVWATGKAKFVPASQLAHLSYYGKEAANTLEAVASMRLLVVDDLGAESTSDVWHGNFSELIYARERSKLKTIITTNLSADTVEKRYGSRVMRRLRDHGRLFGVREKFRQEAA